MNCYGTNPNHTRQLQPVNTMNQQTFPTNTTTTQNTYSTTTSGEWSQPIPTNPNMPTSPASVLPPAVSTMPPTLSEAIYTPGYLRQHIGELMRVEFLIGNQTTDRVGRLQNVGASFIVLQSLEGASQMVCDIYSIRFVTIIRNTIDAQLMAAFPRS